MRASKWHTEKVTIWQHWKEMVGLRKKQRTEEKQDDRERTRANWSAFPERSTQLLEIYRTIFEDKQYRADGATLKAAGWTQVVRLFNEKTQ